MAANASRRAAQRRTAERLRAGERTLPTGLTARPRAAREAYLNDMVREPDKRPPKNSPEGKSLARAAGQARWNRGNPEWIVFKDYWYKDKK